MNKTDEAAIEQARSQFGEPLAPPDEGLSDQKRIQFLQAAVAVDLSHIEQLEKALKDLAFAARTSGGIAGRDGALCAACDYAEGVLNGDERLYGAAPETCDELTRENKAASDFIRGCIEALGIEQPPEGFTISLDALLLQVIGEIESLKGELLERGGLKANVHCDGCGQDYVASLGHLCPAVNGNPQA